MEQRKLNELKGSEKMKIQTAILEVMEESNFSLDKEFGIMESLDNPNNWIIAFQNTMCRGKDYESIKTKLGPKFDIAITSKSKDKFLFRIEAPSEEFMRIAKPLLNVGTILSQPSQPIPSRPPYEPPKN